jgi:hypothetical protein
MNPAHPSSENSPRRLSGSPLDAEIFRRRIEGQSYAFIASELRISRVTIIRSLRNSREDFTRITHRSAAQARLQQIETLELLIDQALLGIGSAAMGPDGEPVEDYAPDPAAIESIRKLLNDLSKLTGADEYAKRFAANEADASFGPDDKTLEELAAYESQLDTLPASVWAPVLEAALNHRRQHGAKIQATHNARKAAAAASEPDDAAE